jgi:acyl carrier protein
MTRNEIEERVTDLLVQALGVSATEIRPDTSLVADLDAESIDFLDIVFRLEKDFGLEVGRGELFPQELLKDPGMVVGGCLTEEGVRALRERAHFTDLSALRPGTRVDQLMMDMLTVRLIVDYIAFKLRTAATSTAAAQA